jgi:hypothetical protein
MVGTGTGAVLAAGCTEEPGATRTPSSGSTGTPTASSSVAQLAKFVPDDSETGDTFGWSVALDGDTAVVGAPGMSSEAGEVYVFTGFTEGGGEALVDWSHQATLTAEGDESVRFGWSVAVDDDTALIGAFDDFAYVFTRAGDSWSQQDKLSAVADDPDEVELGDRFGSSVALDGDTALIGAVGDEDPNGDNAGSVYVFTRSGSSWSHEDKLVAGDGDSGDKFGSNQSVALDGDTALIGAVGDEDPHGDLAGSAYVFTRSSVGWSQHPKLVADDGDEKDRFGVAVALDDGTVLVGAANDDNPGGAIRGSAYVFG